ncbi:MAG TPA: glycosyltransferase family 9 protein [Candidatus Kapabacteria bacterium]|nr:glycosyltransferase family 9 protein [Candidatus Kapabacteria bacterium]
MKFITFDKTTKVKFLIIRLSSMGDIVLTTKLIRNIKLNYPNSEIYFVCNHEYIDILKYNIYIDKLGSYTKNSSENITKLKDDIEAFAPDLAIDLQSNTRSKHLLSNIHHIVSYDKRRLYKLMLVYTKHINQQLNIPIPEIYSKAIKLVLPDFEEDDKGLEFWIESDKLKEQYTPFYKNYSEIKQLRIAVAPGAHFKTKQWLPEYFIELINLLKLKYDCNIIILGGKSEYDLCTYISNKTNSPSYAGQTSIYESAKLIDECNLMICNDTGLMHIAAARQIPVAVFFGSSVQELGFTPYKVANIILEQKLWCRPCSHIGRKKCPLLHFNCMKKTTPKFAFDKIIRLINNLYKID